MFVHVILWWQHSQSNEHTVWLWKSPPHCARWQCRGNPKDFFISSKLFFIKQSHTRASCGWARHKVLISASCVCIGSFLRLYFISQERPFLYRAKIWGIGKLWEVSHLVLSKNRIVDPKFQCQRKCIYFLPPSSFRSLEEDIFCQLPCIIFFSDCNLSTPPSLHDDMMTIIIKLMKKNKSSSLSSSWTPLCSWWLWSARRGGEFGAR